MPLYETVIIAKCASAANSANLLKVFSNKVLSLGGTVRSVKVLGDRILSH